jgi:hypothetical protein
MTRRVPTWSRVVLVLLLPVVAYNIWGYVENRRLEARLNAIHKLGAPTSLSYLYLPQRAPAGEAQADRLYRAACALAAEPQDLPIAARNRVLQAWREGRWSPDAVAIARTAVTGNREALGLVDRAAALPFAGFQAGTSYNYRVGDLLRLCRLCEWRAAVAASDGDGDAALASFTSDARLARVLDLSGSPLGSLPTFSGLSAAAATKTSVPARDALSRALADIDRDDRLQSTLISNRASMLSGSAAYSISWRQAVNGPFEAHVQVRQLDAFAALIAAADAPWPQRIDAVNAVDVWPLGFATRNVSASVVLRNYTKSIAEQVKRIRCARLLVSTTSLTLIDPFTGKPIEVASCHL